MSGDATTSGSNAVTVGKVNGVSYGTSPSTNTVPVVTGTNATTYEAVPNAALANSSTTVAGQTCTLGSSCSVASTNLSDTSNLVRNNAGNTYSTGAQDFGSATSVKIPVSAGATTTTNGFIAYDSTGKNFHGGLNSADSKFASFTVTPTDADCVKWVVSGGNYLLGDAGAACGSGGGGITNLNSLTAATQSFATGTSGSDFNISSATSTHTFNLPTASSSVRGALSSTDWSTFNGKPSLVTAGSAGTAAYNAGTATTAARSDHTHRSVHAITWNFPGTPATGVQNMTLTLPEGITNPAITDMRVTVNTTSSSSSTFNIERCTASCTGASPTFSDIYSSVLTLSASTRTASKGSAPDQNVSGLAAGDQFKAYLATIGSSLADVTVTMTVKYETTN